MGGGNCFNALVRRLPTRSPRELARVALWTLPLIAGCTRLEASGRHEPFRLTHVRPSNAEGLFLNEELVFYFSEEIEPTSVTSASVAIVSEQGIPARGRLEVGIDSVRFVPAPVLAADLSDGGFLPGTRYTVTLAGFPRPEGLRSSRGILHEKSRTWTFATVDVAGPRDSLVFEDRFQGRVGIVRIFPSAGRLGTIVASRDSIYLACDKPLDPSTVLPEAFSLVRDDSPEPVRIRVQLLENQPEAVPAPRPAAARNSGPPQAWERERRACLIEITPEDALVQGTSSSRGPSYSLRLDPASGGSQPLLRDFSGNPVLADSPEGWKISVRDLGVDRGRSELREEFDSRRLRSAVALPGYDGTAAWGDTGRVTVRYPAAAGDGRDGHVVLTAREERVDVQSVSLDLFEGTGCGLRSAPGLVVLRSQGRMTIRGRLSREVLWDPLAELEKDPSLASWSKASRVPGTEGASWTLSGWLDAARAGDWNWTVLIAGGDLSIEGVLNSSGPVLLVAGGTIRVSGSVRGVERAVKPRTAAGAEPASEVALGGVFLPRDSGGNGNRVWPSMSAWLLIDEPIGRNPLVEPLRYAVLSSPVPPAGEVLRWLPPVLGGGPSDPGAPAKAPWSVRFLPELASAPIKPEDLVPVDDPVLISPPGHIQFLIELRVSPGDLWDPPWVDFVHLAWERPADGPRSPLGGR